MKAKCEEYGRRKKGVEIPDVRDRCGKLTLTAERDSDALFLATLLRMMFYDRHNGGRAILADAMQLFCDKENAANGTPVEKESEAPHDHT